MKSMLQEAPTISKAIEKAWNEAGKPREFTVKVLEHGVRTMLGFTKHPAIISFMYDPNMVTERKALPPRQKPQPSRQQQPRDSRRPAPARRGSPSTRERVEVSASDRAKPRPVRRPAEPKQPRPERETKPQPQRSQKAEVEREMAVTETGWSEQWSGDIKGWLDELVGIIKIETPYELKSDGRTLKVHFSETLFTDAEDERMLYSSLSYLLMQSLKKKYKSKFRGFRIVLGS